MLAYDVGSFVLIRWLCGRGLGAAFPNLIAIAAEAAPASRRATGVGLMFSGTPIGGTLLALFVASQSSMDWRAIFLIGGTLPIALVPLLDRKRVVSGQSESVRVALGCRRIIKQTTIVTVPV